MLNLANFTDGYLRFIGHKSDSFKAIDSGDKDFDNIRNKVSLPLVVLERLSHQRHVDIKIIAMAYENLSQLKSILDNL